jgi:hypothetical protein
MNCAWTNRERTGAVTIKKEVLSFLRAIPRWGWMSIGDGQPPASGIQHRFAEPET